MSRNLVLDKITREADELARQWNKIKDPGIRDQWYKLLRTEVPIPDYLQPEQERTYTLDKTYTD